MARSLLEIIIDAKDNASSKINTLSGSLGKLANGGAIVGAGVLVAGAAITKLGVDLVKAAVPAEQLRNTFDNLAKSINEDSNKMLSELRAATSGMVSDQGLFIASNKFVAMGLAKTSEEAANLTKMATQLGSAMGMDAAEAAQDFAMMLANQSIPRLDNFGISSGKVRDRIEELMKKNRGMTREQAFLNAVMEQGAITMEKVGDQSTSTKGMLAQLETTLTNLKTNMGKQLLPIVAKLVQQLSPVINSIAPQLISMVGMIGETFATNVLPVLGQVVSVLLPALISLLPTITTLFGSVANTLLSTLAPSVLQIINALLPLVQLILPPLLALFDQLVSLLTAFLTPIMTQLILLLSQLVIAIMPLIQAILPMFTFVLQLLANLLSGIILPILTKITEWIGSKFSNAVSGLANLIKNNLYKAFAFIDGIMDKIVTGISNLWGWLQKLGQRILSFANSVAAAVRKIVAAFGKFLPGSPIPFVVGITASNKALDKFKKSIGDMSVSPAISTVAGLADNKAVYAGGGGGSIVNITFKDMTLIGDQAQIEWQLKPAIINVLREAMPGARVL